jgi:hypothetical protein
LVHNQLQQLLFQQQLKEHKLYGDLQLKLMVDKVLFSQQPQVNSLQLKH